MSAKVFKTIEEQIDILKSKGLIVEDYDKAKEILLRENYFFLSLILASRVTIPLAFRTGLFS